MGQDSAKIVGVIPAAGRATRLGRLPCSKEILPIGIEKMAGGSRIRVFADLLLEDLSEAGVVQTIVATHPSKRDIERYLGSIQHEMHMHYVYLESNSTVHSIDACYEFTAGNKVLLGFPDILLPPHLGFSDLLAELENSAANVVLGLFPTQDPQSVDMVSCSDDRRVLDIAIKPLHCPSDYSRTWSVAAWDSTFTDFVHTHIERVAESLERELYVGDMIVDALHAGLGVRALNLSDQESTDLGTPESYWNAITGLNPIPNA